MRKVHINGQKYWYKIGKVFIPIFTPNGVKFLANQSLVSGLSWNELERGYWKGWFKGITPKMIKEYITKEKINEAL